MFHSFAPPKAFTQQPSFLSVDEVAAADKGLRDYFAEAITKLLANPAFP